MMPPPFKILFMRSIIKVLVFVFFIPLFFYGQNHVKNYSFENDLTSYNKFYAWINSSSFGYNFIDSLSQYWYSLYGSSFRFNNKYQEKDYKNDIISNGNNSLLFKQCMNRKPFHKDGYALLMPSFRSIDTVRFTPKFWVQNTGNPNDSDIYWGNNPIIFSQLSIPLIRDTTYIISYRLLSGNGIGEYKLTKENNVDDYNFTNNFGVHFTVNSLGDLSTRPYDRRSFKVNGISPALQDTTLDTTFRWRLIQREFKADADFNFIYFGQFLDKRKNKYKISKSLFIDGSGAYYYFGGEFNVSFAFFLDDIRLLPKWQYLDVTPDITACAGDSIELKVLSGAGGYVWTEVNNPKQILSTQKSIKIKLADTNISYQVMSPYDTALIVVYVNIPVYDTMYIINCGNYMWRSKLLSLSGTYQDSSINANGCKNYYTLHFKRTINDKITKLDTIELKADQDSVSYQWYSCSPWTKLEGETKRTLKGTKGKSYAVVLNNGKGCIDTSDCVTLGASSIVAEEKLDWRVYPNPFQETFNIELDRIYNAINIKLYHISGQLIVNESVKNMSSYSFHTSNLPSGLYYLQVETESASKFYNLRKD